MGYTAECLKQICNTVKVVACAKAHSKPYHLKNTRMMLPRENLSLLMMSMIPWIHSYQKHKIYSYLKTILELPNIQH